MKAISSVSRVIVSIVMVVYLMVAMVPMTANAVSEGSKSSLDGKIVGVTLRTYKTTDVFQSSNARTTNLCIYSNQRLKILEEKSERFKVKLGDGKFYWIKCNECIINIAEYIPSLVINLDMAMTENYFSMGGEKIPGLTDKQFYTNPGSINGTEAWMRYSAAKKLFKAQQMFLKDGFSICVFDAYRPFTTSMQFKDAYSKYLSGKSTQFKNKWFGQLGESWFLAQKASSHNFGNAVDMTIVSVKTGKELSMPSNMHTLDYTSAYYMWKDSETTAANNARYMKYIMESAGFTYLKSEWWHFQDNATKGDVIDVEN